MKKYLLKLGLIGVLFILTLNISAQTFPTLFPENTGEHISISANPSLTFSETISYPNDGIFKISLMRFTGGTWSEENYFNIFVSGGTAFPGSGNIILESNKITISPSSDFNYGTNYSIVVPSNLTDTDGFSGTNETNWSFTTESLAPTIDSLSPTDNSLDVATEQNLTITFNENITFGTGSETLTINDGTGSVQSFTVGDPELDITGSQLTITHDAFANSTNYHVLMDPGFVASSSTETDFDGISDPATWNFTTVAAPPSITGLSPADNATNVSTNADLTITFNEDITAGTGYLQLHQGTGYEAINISEATITSNQLTIPNASINLETDLDYHIEIDAGFVTSTNTGIDFGGISDVTTWNFHTEIGAPAWISSSPSISNQTNTSVDLSMEIDQDGDYYYVITSSFTQPTELQIEGGLDESGNTADISKTGTLNANSAITENIDISGLTTGTTYFLHVVASNGSAYTTIESFSIDLTAPNLGSVTPPNGDTMVPINTNVELIFSEKIYDNTGTPINSTNIDSHITISDGTTNITYTPTFSNNDKTITLDPDSDLNPNTTYTISFATAFEDSYGNQQEAIITDKTFTTKEAGLIIWTGSSSTWEDTNNWDEPNFPQAGDNVYIPADASSFPLISTTDVTVNDLTIEAGASLTQTGAILTVNGTFTLKSSVNGNASYIPKGGTLSVTSSNVRIEQVITASDRNYNISSPVFNPSISSTGITNRVYSYDNSVNDPVTGYYQEVSSSADLSPGKGYVCRSDQDLVFTGIVNTGNYNLTLTSNETGFNLIGNPYPAYINPKTVLENHLSTLSQTVYIWRNQEGHFGTYNYSTDIGVNGVDSPLIPSNQSFFVYVTSESGTSTEISLTPDIIQDTQQSTSYLKSSSSSTQNPIIKLSASYNDGTKDQTAISFISNALSVKDRYDSKKFFSNKAGTCEVFTVTEDGTEVVINGLPFEEGIEIPLGFSTKQTGLCKLQIDNWSLGDEYKFYLIDKNTGTYNKITPDFEYEFEATNTGINKERFILMGTKQNVPTNLKAPEKEKEVNINVFYQNQNLIIDIPQLNNPKFNVVDVSGRILKAGELAPSSETKIKIQRKGLVFVNIYSENHKIKTVKVVI